MDQIFHLNLEAVHQQQQQQQQQPPQQSNQNNHNNQNHFGIVQPNPTLLPGGPANNIARSMGGSQNANGIYDRMPFHLMSPINDQ